MSVCEARRAVSGSASSLLRAIRSAIATGVSVADLFIEALGSEPALRGSMVDSEVARVAVSIAVPPPARR